MDNPAPPPGASQLAAKPLWQRVLWMAAGSLALAAGIVGIFLPLLPTTPFVLLAAFCFSRGSERLERWLLAHRTFGPMVRNWRKDRSIPLRAKQVAWVMMTLGSLWGAYAMPRSICWIPALTCLAVGVWMYRLPTRG